MPADQLNRDRWRCCRDKHSASYDKQTQFFDRVLFADSRSWVCSQATGDTLEVAIGTGLNLPLYPDETRLTGIDLSPAMLGVARHRAEQVGRAVDLREADALALPFPDACFDTVVCTFALCAIPDHRRAVSEMNRCCAWAGSCCWPIAERLAARKLAITTASTACTRPHGSAAST